ncbi:MAG: YtxH domain-containing protein [Actinomycetes bacterium]
MRYKATFLVGFGVGYVLGARAGRERYEAIARTTRRLLENPAVQETAGVLQAQAINLVDDARRVAADALGGLVRPGGSHSGVPSANGNRTF